MVTLDGGRAVGLGMAVLGLATTVLAARLGEGTETGGPGTRFLPVLLGVIVAVLGAGIALRPVPAGADRPTPAATGGPARAAWTIAAIVAYVLLFERLGFLLVTPPFLAALLLAYGERRWPVVVAVALVAPGAAYALFALWLQVPLPPGPLGR